MVNKRKALCRRRRQTKSNKNNDKKTYTPNRISKEAAHCKLFTYFLRSFCIINQRASECEHRKGKAKIKC